MASPVDTSVKHITNTMSGAPVLNGVAGSLISLLQAFLVDGFDNKSATSLVVASGVATLSFTGAHSATVDSVVLVSGATPSNLNGEQKVTAVAAGVVKFATAESDGTATGTISFKMAPVGWTQPFSGTNLAVFRSSDLLGGRMYLRVDDTNATNPRVRSYETMSDVSTGTGPSPTDAQISGGGYWSKSGVANSNPITYVIAADSRALLVYIARYQISSAGYYCGAVRGFGDIVSHRPSGDLFGSFLSATQYAGNMSDTSLDGYYPSAFIARSHTGLGASVTEQLWPIAGSRITSSGLDSAGAGPFPSPIDGGLRLTKVAVGVTANSTVRGTIPGFYRVPHTTTFPGFKNHDVVLGTGSMSGRKLIAVNSTSGGGTDNTASYDYNTGVSFIDVTGPWR